MKRFLENNLKYNCPVALRLHRGDDLDYTLRWGWGCVSATNPNSIAHIPLEFASASANFRVANAENDAQTT